jgi:hypothetical protein
MRTNFESIKPKESNGADSEFIVTNPVQAKKSLKSEAELAEEEEF